MSWHERDYAGLGGGGRGTGGFGMFSAGSGSRFTDNPLNWSPTLGHLFGIRIRVHVTFIIFVVFELLRPGLGWLGTFQWLVLLFGSVFLHELGHCFAARRVGGSAFDILMWPLGGLASVDPPRRPWPSFVTVAWGPLVNVFLFSIAGIILLATGARLAVSGLNPIGWFGFPEGLSDFQFLVLLLFAVNMALFLFNLYPMYPMDGGRMVHCALWHYRGYQRATLTASTVGMVAAVPLGLYGLASQQYLLLVIAFLGYLTCYQERLLVKAGIQFGAGDDAYDLSAAYGPHASAARPRRPGVVARFRERARARRIEAQRRRSEELEAEIDQILDKIHRDGLQSLSNKEKRILEEASHRRDGR